MPKLTLYHCSSWLVCAFLCFGFQNATAQYRLKVASVDAGTDSVAVLNDLDLKTNFRSRLLCEQYVNTLRAELQNQGFAAASIDSVHFDSTEAFLQLYLGDRYELAGIRVGDEDRKLLESFGWSDPRAGTKPLKLPELQVMQNRILRLFENNGYPFAKIRFDSVSMEEKVMLLRLNIERGPLYKVDSIRTYGKVRIANHFLQRYLEIPNGSTYQREKLEAVSNKLRELPFLKEQQNWTMTMLGTGSILNLYLEPRKSSQVNVLVGFLPAHQQTINNKTLITGEANVNLQNALGKGEGITMNWQQIQVRSPRFDMGFQVPYLFKSPFGLSAAFNLFRKDSSFLNLSFVAGLQYALSSRKTGRLFIQNLSSNLLSVDTAAIRRAKRLPDVVDVRSFNVGVDYMYNTTDYRFNPRRGWDLQLMVSAGRKTIRKNNVITTLKDPQFNYAGLYDSMQLNTYQVRSRISAAYYIPAGRSATLKTALHGGIFESPSVFRNEIFQIGGYKLLRGFDEEGIFASRYAVATVEYRYLIGLNSFLFSFVDAGWAAQNTSQVDVSNTYLGAGLGMAFETKAGIFNISYAAGKQSDRKFDIRQSKIHLGYVNFF